MPTLWKEQHNHIDARIMQELAKGCNVFVGKFSVIEDTVCFIGKFSCLKINVITYSGYQKHLELLFCKPIMTLGIRVCSKYINDSINLFLA